MSEIKVLWRQVRRAVFLGGASLAAAACGMLPYDDVEVDRSWYVGHCLPHQPAMAENARPVGPEDLTMDANGVLYVSSNDYTIETNSVSRRAGAIYRYDVARDGKVAPMRIRSESDRVPAYFEKNFFPHGISLLEANGEKRLFVINHRIQQRKQYPDERNLANVFDLPRGEVRHSYVEIFRIEADKDGEVLVHERTVNDKDALAGQPAPHAGRGVLLSDVVAVGPQQFFATNNPRGFMDKFDISMFHNSLGNVLYFDGKGYRVAVDGIDFGDGINIGADNKVLYLATMRHGELIAYKTNLNRPGESQPGKIELMELPTRVRLEGHLDNIEWVNGERRQLLVATHSNLAAVGLQRLEAPVKANSRIVRVGLAEDGALDKNAVKLVYANDGDQVSAASVAAYYKDKNRERLIVGSLLDDSFLVCRIDAH